MGKPLLPVSNVAYQLALDVFGDDTPLAAAPLEIGFRKSRVLLDARRLDVTGRKALNAIYFIASASEDQEEYNVDLDFFKWLMRFDSKNHAHLQKSLEAAQKTQLKLEHQAETSDRSLWVSVPLVGRVAIGQGRILFKLDELMRRQARDPRSFFFLSLPMTVGFKSKYALALYEFLKSESYRGTTDWIEVAELRSWLGIEESSTMAEFKAMRKHALDVALAEINKDTDIQVRYETRAMPGSKRIQAVRFVIQENARGRQVLTIEGAKTVSKFFRALRDEFKLSNDFLTEIASHGERWTEERIAAAMELTRYRIAVAPPSKPVRSPGAFLMTMIREGASLTDAEQRHWAALREAQDRGERGARLALQQQRRAGALSQAARARADTVLQAFRALPAEEQRGWLAKFKRTTLGRAACARVDIARDPIEALLENGPFRSTLAAYLADGRLPAAGAAPAEAA